MNDELKRFLEEVQADPQLLERLNSMQTAAEILKEAAQRGFNFSESDLTAATEEYTGKPGPLCNCTCAVGGGGNQKTDYDGAWPYNCGCAVFGMGFCNDDGYPTCFCLAAGSGWPRD